MNKAILAQVLALMSFMRPDNQNIPEIETDVEGMKKRSLKQYEIEKNQPISKRKMRKKLGKKKKR